MVRSMTSAHGAPLGGSARARQIQPPSLRPSAGDVLAESLLDPLAVPLAVEVSVVGAVVVGMSVGSSPVPESETPVPDAEVAVSVVGFADVSVVESVLTPLLSGLSRCSTGVQDLLPAASMAHRR